jgi:hypothetical protein
MPVKGLKEVRQQLKTTFGKIKGPMVEKALVEVLITAGGFAATMTPIDTSNLINSGYRKITAMNTKVVGVIGYTAAYAAAVHDAKGTLLGTNTPRSTTDPSRGNFWDPNAEPEFLKKAFEEPDARAAIDEVMRRNMILK